MTPMKEQSNVVEELERLFERMSRQFDDASYRWESQGPLMAWPSGTDEMSIDLVDRDDELVVTVDLPGFERDDIQIRVTDHTLRIEAEREEALGDESDRFLRHERRRESVQRSIRLPDEVDKAESAARINNGVLTVTLPKVEAETAREIEVKGE